MARRLRRDGQRIDVIHAHVVLPAGLVAAHAAAELDVPFVLQEHSGPFAMHLDTAEKVAAVNDVLHAASSVLAVSNALAKDIRAALPESNVTTMPNLVRTDIFQAAESSMHARELRLVSVGGLLPVKNHAAQIACLAELVSRGVSASLTLVGEGPLKEELGRVACDLDVENRVTFLGHISRGATAEAIASAHIYVCTSEVETFGLAVAEALAVGRPVVTTACGGPEEIVDPALGAVVSSAHPESLASAVMRLADRLDQFVPAEMHATIDKRFGARAFDERMLTIYDKVRSALSSAVRLPI